MFFFVHSKFGILKIYQRLILMKAFIVNVLGVAIKFNSLSCHYNTSRYNLMLKNPLTERLSFRNEHFAKWMLWLRDALNRSILVLLLLMILLMNVAIDRVSPFFKWLYYTIVRNKWRVFASFPQLKYFIPRVLKHWNIYEH